MAQGRAKGICDRGKATAAGLCVIAPRLHFFLIDQKERMQAAVSKLKRLAAADAPACHVSNSMVLNVWIAANDLLMVQGLNLLVALLAKNITKGPSL
eukprot:156235-Pelagomonas_calceolata.AAC.1